MKKKSPPPRIPPLPARVLRSVELLEEIASRTVRAASDPVRMLVNTERVGRVLRTCVVESLKIQLNHYESLPIYRPEWATELAEATINSLIGLFPLFTDGEPFRPELERTGCEYMEQRRNEAAQQNAPAPIIGRKELRDSYFAAFPAGVKILDVCWAAGQHYCDWKRWLRDAVKDGSAPDRAFVALLKSGKRPEEYRKQRRPKGWK